MKRLLVLALLVSLGLNVALALRLREAIPTRARDSQGRSGHFRPAPGDSQAWRARMDRRFERMSRMLELDPRQEEAFRRQRAGAEEEIRARMAALESRRATLRAESGRESPDPAAVTAALAAVGRAEAEIDSLVAVNLRAELELLNPQQRSRLLRSLHFERLGGRGGPGSGHGPRRGRRGSGPDGRTDRNPGE